MDKIIRVARARYADTDRSKDHNFDASPNNWLFARRNILPSFSCSVQIVVASGKCRKCRNRCIGNGHHYQYLANRYSVLVRLEPSQRWTARLRISICIHTRLFFTSRLARQNRWEDGREVGRDDGSQIKCTWCEKRSNTILLWYSLQRRLFYHSWQHLTLYDACPSIDRWLHRNTIQKSPYRMEKEKEKEKKHTLMPTTTRITSW